MKRLLIISLLPSLFLCLFSLSVFAQAKIADYSGEWTLDKAKSKLPDRMAHIEGMNLKVSQGESKFKVTMETKQVLPKKTADGAPVFSPGGSNISQTLSYSLEGKEISSESDGPMGGTSKVVTSAKTDGDKLNLTTLRTLSMPIGESVLTTKDSWELQADGSLKIKRQLETQQGNQTAELIFVRKNSK